MTVLSIFQYSYAVGLRPADTTTLIPFLKEMEENLGISYKKVMANAGYDSEENYGYLDEGGKIAFIKPASYEQSKSRKYKKDIGRPENMAYDEAADTGWVGITAVSFLMQHILGIW